MSHIKYHLKNTRRVNRPSKPFSLPRRAAYVVIFDASLRPFCWIRIIEARVRDGKSHRVERERERARELYYVVCNQTRRGGKKG